MSNLTDFFPSGGGGGLTPKFQEFTASGTFTPSQALIDAGGYIEVFLVAGGQAGGVNGQGVAYGGQGGEAFFKNMYLTNNSPCSVNIGAGGAGGNTAGPAGGNSTFLGSSAGGQDLTAIGGGIGGAKSSPSWQGGPGGVFGFGGGAANSQNGGFNPGKPNTGQASYWNSAAASGYCLIKWYE